MKKTIALLAVALGLSALLLTACTAPADSAQVSQPIASPTVNAPVDTKSSTVVSSQDPDQALPTPGASVSINTPQPTDVSGRITEEDAKEIALTHAGVSESDTTALRIKLDYDAGVEEYEVSFYVGNREYDYDIDTKTGTIRSFDSEIEDDIPVASAPAAPASSGSVSEDEAKQIALTHAGVSESETERLRVKFERDDGVDQYEVTFHVGAMEYDYEINANTGKILKSESEYDDDYVSPTEASGAAVSEDEARSIFAAQVEGASASDVRVKLERDDGRMIYECKLILGSTEYEGEIDAATGKILDWDVDSIYD